MTTDQPTLPWLGVRRDGVRWRAWLLAASSADETYTKCFRTLKEEHALSEGP